MAGTDGISKQPGRNSARLSSLLGRDAMLLLLSWVGGSTDAVTYLGLGHVFTANVTGNTILLGIAIGQGLLANEIHTLLALLGFCGGAAVGSVLTEGSDGQEDWPVILSKTLTIEAVLLAAFAFLWYLTWTARSPILENVLIGLSALAMGLQSVAVLRVGVAGVVTTYVSGTWATFVVSLVRNCMQRKGPDTAEQSTCKKKSHLALDLAVLFIYGLAAVISGLGESRWPKITPLLPLLIVLIVVVNASLQLRHVSQRDEIRFQP